MTIKNTKQKGRRLVKELVEIFRRELDQSTYEVVGSGQGKDKGDLRIPKLDLVIEVKNQKKVNIAQWIEQAEAEGLGYSNWALIWKHPKRKEIYVDTSLDFFIELLKRYQEPIIKADDREFKYKLNNLKNAVNQLLKEFK